MEKQSSVSSWLTKLLSTKKETDIEKADRIIEETRAYFWLGHKIKPWLPDDEKNMSLDKLRKAALSGRLPMLIRENKMERESKVRMPIMESGATMEKRIDDYAL